MSDKNILGSLCGIDEAGRGPLAGSLYVVGCILKKKIDGLNDSKKLSEKRRSELFLQIVENSYFHISIHTAKEIDSLGLSACIKDSIIQIKKTLAADKYLFDGNSSFGVPSLKTMIKADTKVSAVMAASIIAKVSRDKEMVELDNKYPQYGFAKHKGYGTAAHIEAIRQYGLCKIHRESFKPKKLQASLL